MYTTGERFEGGAGPRSRKMERRNIGGDEASEFAGGRQSWNAAERSRAGSKRSQARTNIETGEDEKRRRRKMGEHATENVY
jgi:hypothetical protein